MTAEDLIERLFCQVEQIDNFDLRCGKLAVDLDIQNRWEAFKKIAEKIPLLITCGIGRTFAEINELITMAEPKPRAVFIDYVQNISSRPGETRETINEYIRQFNKLAMQMKFAGVLCSQINRGAEQTSGKEPSLGQLKESGFLEEAAHTVLLLHWENFYDHTKPETTYKIIIAKNRNGKTGDHLVEYTPKHYLFSEIHLSEEHQKVKEVFNAKTF
jgi:replicative DNA helicase